MGTSAFRGTGRAGKTESGYDVMSRNGIRWTDGLLCVGAAACDQAVKALVRRAPLGTVFFELPGLMQILHCANTGAAFSVLSGHTALIALISLAILAALGALLVRLPLTRTAARTLALLLGGGLGNLIDRVLFGSVTDYIRVLFVDFPVFNLADICITLSVGMLLVLGLTDRLEESE